MPDSNGNLTSMQDFLDGHLVRFHSNLASDLVLGTQEYDPAVYHLGHDSSINTIFKVGRLGASDFFRISFEFEKFRDWGMKLMWRDLQHLPFVLTFETEQVAYGDDQEAFRVDMLDESPWFALNNADGTLVADVKDLKTADGTPVIHWRWNGGRNQWWRAQIVV